MNVFQKMFGTHSEREVKRIMPLVEKGIIKMSIPEKPKSPKQLFYCD